MCNFLAAILFVVIIAHASGATAQPRPHELFLPRDFAHDVRVALRGLVGARTPQPAKKRALTAPGRCLAVPPQVVVGLNGTHTSDGNGGESGGGAQTSSGAANAGSGATATSSAGTSKPAPTTGAPSGPGKNSTSPWKVAQRYAGNTFFNGWDWWTAADPTAGHVDYVDQATASARGLISINGAGNALMRVDTTPQISGPRMSVRIQTQYGYTGALIVLDAVHVPTGCATWPAFWSNGPDWPNHGEIDILEGVNDNALNQATIHTRTGCTVPPTTQAAGAAGSYLVGGANCDVAATNNAGCGAVVQDPPNSYGPAFNANGGGVYAMLWDNTAISVWWFPRGSIPADIVAGAPLPDSWSAPFARWPGTNCNTMDFFNNHNAIFDTTLCGIWAGGVWNSAGSPGQEQSCAQRTGYASCEQYVEQHGEAFAEAYWEVKSMVIYQHS